MNTLSTFFQNFFFKNFSKPKKSIVQNTKVQRHVTPPPLISSSQKVITFRTNERTNIPVLTVRTDVKSANKNKYKKNRQQGDLYFFSKLFQNTKATKIQIK